MNTCMWISFVGWALFIVCWGLLRNATKENVQHRTRQQQVMAFMGYVLAFVLLYLPVFINNRVRILPATAGWQLTGAVLCIVGIGLCIWSRLMLGVNWSGGVAAKKAHELIVSGPYHWVRHPIYTGFIMALAGTCLVTGSWPGMFITVLYTLGLCVKIGAEEKLLCDLFPDAYSHYQQRTHRLIPFLW
ncbi:methyltransferase family protein [Chitinophaga nivalis]|uniref:Isoprenylcysteine carboxylmethyltransferase family protein n=1 Tax=Chitinophaga nivalis TaxID=2991709 RepID=A0ABT3IKT8_9BACT|nr:isoprenylcysteine carboxylmethyltransferase family protein [Chitinophaga nivalis]MCW3465732.1 isoprenylcysteine carboxylmethyltransferase family protein [Chitinophaga nivalis]MCW3484577.1 isoprenylcysteine carboxylmethyltransferase family protein [Chitinophaga nivalis]